MPDPGDGRRFYLKTTIQELQPTIPGRVYWLRLKQKKDALFPGHCFEQHSAAMTATGGSVSFGIPFVLKLKRDARQKWKPNRLAISVHEGSFADDPHGVVTSFHLDLPDLYDACVDGLYTFRQFVRGNVYLTFACQRIDPTIPFHSPMVPNTPASPRPAADLQLVQELVLMFPTLPAIHVRHAVESFATREEVIDYLLQHQGSGGTILAPTSVPSPARPPPADPPSLPPAVVSTAPLSPAPAPAVLEEESEESDFRLAQRLQELETVRFDNEQREFERRLLTGQVPEARPAPAPAPPARPALQDAAAVPTAVSVPQSHAAAAEGRPVESPGDEAGLQVELCAAVRAAVAGATEEECRGALDNTDWNVELAASLLLMQRMDTALPPRAQG